MTNPIIHDSSTCYSVMAFSSQLMKKYLYILHVKTYKQSCSDSAKMSPLNYSALILPVKQLCTQTTHILSLHNFDRLNLLFHRQVALVFNPTQPPLLQNTENTQWQQLFPKCVSWSATAVSASPARLYKVHILAGSHHGGMWRFLFQKEIHLCCHIVLLVKSSSGLTRVLTSVRLLSLCWEANKAEVANGS